MARIEAHRKEAVAAEEAATALLQGGQWRAACLSYEIALEHFVDTPLACLAIHPRQELSRETVLGIISGYAGEFDRLRSIWSCVVGARVQQRSLAEKASTQYFNHEEYAKRLATLCSPAKSLAETFTASLQKIAGRPLR